MKRFIIYLTVLMLFTSCKIQQVNVASLCGRFGGVEGDKSPLSTYVLLELNKDSTCLLTKTFDLFKHECRGEWTLLNDDVIEIKCNNNPIQSDIEKALQGGCYIDGTLQIKILNINKLKLKDVILKRKK